MGPIGNLGEGRRPATMRNKTMAAKSATLAKGLDILNVVGGASSPTRLRDIMAALDLPKPTAHRILSTLVDYGLIRFNSGDRTYQLGMRLFEMSRRVWEDFDLRGTSAEELRRLGEMTEEAIGLALLDGVDAVYVDEIESPHHVRVRTRMGQRVPLWETAIGKAIFAGIDDEEREKKLSAIARSAPGLGRFGSIDRLRHHLDLVNARGYAIENEEHIRGVRGVAAPILDHRGLAVAAIGLTAPADRLTRDGCHALGPALIDATRRASLQAGGSPRPVSAVPRPVAPSPAGIKSVAATQDLIGEDPKWSVRDQQLHWVDICGPAIHRFDPRRGALVTIRTQEMVTSLALTEGGIVAASQSGLLHIDGSTGETIRVLGHPEAHLRTNRFNTGKCDRRGRLWISTMAINVKAGQGSLYRVDPDLKMVKMERDQTLPNGVGWSPDDRRMYLTESAKKTIFEYDFDAVGGTIANRRALIQLPEADLGSPAGLTVDAEGYLWISVWDGWRLLRYSPTGQLDREVIMPVPRPTACAFGGSDLRTLYITSARIRVLEQSLAEAPTSGDLHAYDVDVRGLPEPLFRFD